MPPGKETASSQRPARQPATTPEGRMQQMGALAEEVAEKQMLAGTASAQVITHYLKQTTLREQLEQEKIRNENLRLEAQIAQINAQSGSTELGERVIAALTIYKGSDDDDDY